MSINPLKAQSTMLLCNQIDLLAQQSRNTYILKRRYPVPLHKKNQKVPQLKHRYFIYDLVENTVSRKQSLINLILLQSVKNVGVKGQKVTVNSEMGYINLLLPKMAVYATPENIEKYLMNDPKIVKQSNIYSSKYVERTISKLSSYYLLVSMSMFTPWTIEKWHIKVTFRKAGIIVPEDSITLPEKPISGPDLSIQNKQFYVTVKINNCEEVKVRCIINHWSTNNDDKIKFNKHIWTMPVEAIFPEDQPILDSLPKHCFFEEKINDTNE